MNGTCIRLKAELTPVWRQKLHSAVVMVAAACCLPDLGCHGRKSADTQSDQIRSALNSFYATEPACLWVHPVRLERSKTEPEAISAGEARALDDAGLIDIERHAYKLTSAGRAFWSDDRTQPGSGNLCFGKWRVGRVDSMTARHDDVFGNVTETQFEATVAPVALWTRSPGMQKAFPLMSLEVSKALPHSATMKQTDKGWQVAAVAVPTAP